MIALYKYAFFLVLLLFGTSLWLSDVKMRKRKNPEFRIKKSQWLTISLYVIMIIGFGILAIASTFKVSQFIISNGETLSGAKFVIGASEQTKLAMIDVKQGFVDNEADYVYYKYLALGVHNPKFYAKKDTELSIQTPEENNIIDKTYSEYSANNAYIAAYKYIGKPLEISTAFRVITPLKAFPETYAIIKRGDEIIKFDNHPMIDLKSLEKYIAVLMPDTIMFTVKRGEEIHRIPVKLVKKYRGLYQLGFYIGEEKHFALPDGAPQLTTKAVDGGDSAGMMMALQLIETVTGKKLTNGEFVAGTGAINADGNVSDIGGLYNKVATVKQAGKYKAMLVPATQEKEAKDAAKDLKIDFKIIPVATLADAVEKLKQLK